MSLAGDAPGRSARRAATVVDGGSSFVISSEAVAPAADLATLRRVFRRVAAAVHGAGG
jgi:hypothetical protein